MQNGSNALNCDTLDRDKAFWDQPLPPRGGGEPPRAYTTQHFERPLKWWSLTAVVAVHLTGLAYVLTQTNVTPPVAVPPSIVGVLIAPQPKPTPPAAQPTPPKPAAVQTPAPNPVATKPVATKPVAPKPVKPPKPVEADKPVPVVNPKPTPVAAPSPPVTASAPQAAAETTPARAVPPSNNPAPVNTPPAPVPVTAPISDASHLNNPRPEYPKLSRRMGEQGRVLLDVYILPDGRVGEIKLNRSSGFPRLDHAALQAVRSWRYVPAKRGDQAIAFWYVQPVSFELKN